MQGFYHQHFWQRYRLAGLHDQALAEKVLSFVVNSERGGGLALQKAINALGGDVSVDGVIGHKTVAAANQLDAEVLSIALSVYIGVHYIGQEPEQKEAFLKGWLRRALA